MARFDRFNQPFNCIGCGKHTSRVQGSNTELCRKCFDEAGLENEHQDGYHEPSYNGPHADCPMCKAAAAAPAAATG